MQRSAGSSSPSKAAVPSSQRPTGRYREQYGVIVLCQDERHQQRVYAHMRRAGHNCRVVVT